MGAVQGNRVPVRRNGAAAPERAVVSRHVRDVQPGELVWLMLNAGQLWVVGIMGTAPVPELPPPVDIPGEPPPAPPAVERPVSRGTTVMGPAWSGTHRGGTWRRDTNHLIQGDGGWGRSWGAAFWPESLRMLGRITAARLRCERLSFGVYSRQHPTMLLLEGGKTSSFPRVLASAVGPGLGGPGSVETWTVPSDWLPRLSSGEAGGIGIGVDASTPYMRLDGADFALSVDWERTD